MAHSEAPFVLDSDFQVAKLGGQITLKALWAKLGKMMFVGILLICATQNAMAQEEADNNDYKAFMANGHIKNMHIWHGFVVHPGAVFATSLEYNSPNGKFTFGVWGGASFTSVDVENKDTGEYVSATYKEFSLYTKYRFSNRFFIEAVSHNNYTGVEERGDVLRFWSYDKTQGYNFVDLNFGYSITPKTFLYLATILGGGSGDYEEQADGSLKNSWTHYFEVKHKIWEKDTANVSLFAGGAWSFITDKTFYTDSAGNMVNIGVIYAKDLNIGTYKVPVEVTAMWNPEMQKTVLQLDITLF
ncbi:hypothetical protein [Maribacter polysaccharolyticus]|uniref:hypothetical protein n=1 Tax=Maribacter polysaccharolyticus TaxID=3020831 RepID=UPI00237FA718|nr:hypothetical protein [Maribacter polysaccharolyticus]MDE3740522.1 hypothetical protein [Maribacter polysaccharolyticus]